MGKIAVLDANCYIDLEGPDHPDSSLAELSRLAFEGRVSLYVTPELAEELSRDADEARRERQLAHAKKFPLIPTSYARRVDELSSQFHDILFAGTESARRKPRRISDCRQLAYAVEFEADFFVTNDKEILRRADNIKLRFLVSVLTPDEMVQVAKEEELGPLPQLELLIPKLLITDAERKHKQGILDLLRDLDQDYPQFLSDWLPKKLDDPSLRKKIIAIRDKVAAISISGDKGDHVVKLSTFFTSPDFRELGLGQHLLHHEIINWANRGVRKVLVTFPSGKKEMIPFFRRYGFWIEGVSPLRYGKRAELVMGRYFLYEVVRTEDWPRFVENLISDIFVCNQLGEAEGAMRLPLVKGSDFVCPLREIPLTIKDQFSADGANLAVLDYASGNPLMELDCYRLETDFFPLLLHTPGRTAALVPIEPKWAELLFEFEREQSTMFESHERVRLRSDNVYYRSGTDHGKVRRGTPLVFYVSGDIGQVVGVAKTRSVEIGDPEDIYAKYGPLGVFTKEEVTDAASLNGRVQAIRFDYYEPLAHPITLSRLRGIVPNVTLQTSSKLDFSEYLKIRQEGGLPNAR